MPFVWVVWVGETRFYKYMKLRVGSHGGNICGGRYQVYGVRHLDGAPKNHLNKK